MWTKKVGIKVAIKEIVVIEYCDIAIFLLLEKHNASHLNVFLLNSSARLNTGDDYELQKFKQSL